jgi:tripartite-type tricarboxylate transporter receptor subunit TctC
MTGRFLLAAVSILVCVPVPAARADWPERPVHWIVPFGPGGANDLIARVAAEAVRKGLGQPIVIENRPAPSPARLRWRKRHLTATRS